MTDEPTTQHDPPKKKSSQTKEPSGGARTWEVDEECRELITGEYRQIIDAVDSPIAFPQAIRAWGALQETKIAVTGLGLIDAYRRWGQAWRRREVEVSHEEAIRHWCFQREVDVAQLGRSIEEMHARLAGPGTVIDNSWKVVLDSALATPSCCEGEDFLRMSRFQRAAVSFACRVTEELSIGDQLDVKANTVLLDRTFQLTKDALSCDDDATWATVLSYARPDVRNRVDLCALLPGVGFLRDAVDEIAGLFNDEGRLHDGVDWHRTANAGILYAANMDAVSTVLATRPVQTPMEGAREIRQGPAAAAHELAFSRPA